MKLSSYINSILELENSNKLSQDDCFKIDGFDRSILILDDIEDKSEIRDSNPCYHITHGIPQAKKEAARLYKEALVTFDKLCRQRNIGIIKSFYVKFLLKKLHRNIKLGQAIDKRLQSSQYDPNLFPKYYRTIRLFTGGHIKYAFLIGFILSNKRPDYKKQVASIGEDIGILRQIDDDIKDYSDYHHEALGDLVQHKNRLPELLFNLYANPNEKTRLAELLINHSANQEEIKKLVFNDKVQKHIENKVIKLKNKIDLKVNALPEKYKDYLSQLMFKFLQ